MWIKPSKWWWIWLRSLINYTQLDVFTFIFKILLFKQNRTATDSGSEAASLKPLFWLILLRLSCTVLLLFSLLRLTPLSIHVTYNVNIFFSMWIHLITVVVTYYMPGNNLIFTMRLWGYSFYPILHERNRKVESNNLSKIKQLESSRAGIGSWYSETLIYLQFIHIHFVVRKRS